MAKRVSTTDVARVAGVSVGTVSHALNHPERLAPATLEKVNRAIEQLGFVRSGSARQLRAGRSDTVALMVEDIRNPYYIEAAHAIEGTLAAQDIALMLCVTGDCPARRRRAVRQVLEHEVRGTILAAETGIDQILAALQPRDMALVLLDTAPSQQEIACISVDHVLGGRLAVSHLLHTGHRRIAVVIGPLEIAPAAQRWQGAQLAVEQAGMDPDDVLCLVVADAFSADCGATATEEILARHRDCTAVFAGNDVMALGAMRTLRERGMRIPDDMAVVGYDDIPVAAELITPLTSVRQPLAQMGRAAATLLVDSAHVTQPMVFAPTLVIRESAPGPSPFVPDSPI